MKLYFLCFALLAGATVANTVPVSLRPNQTSVSISLGSDKKVENYVSVLKKDLEAQEASLKAFVARAEGERGSKKSQLASLVKVLNHLHEQLLNTTKYYHEYNGFVSTAEAKLKPLTVEYDRAFALYTETKGKVEEERRFLDTLLAYIRNRKKCEKVWQTTIFTFSAISTFFPYGGNQVQSFQSSENGIDWLSEHSFSWRV